MNVDRWRNLEIWELADDLAYKTYMLTQVFQRKKSLASLPDLEERLCPYRQIL